MLELIEGRNGVLKAVDDECLMPNGDDTKLSNKLVRQFEGHEHFAADAKQRRSREFAVVHYAGAVVYCTEGFIDKNRDALMPEADELLRSSSDAFLATLLGAVGAARAAVLAAPADAPRRPRRAAARRRASAPPPLPAAGRPARARRRRLVRRRRRRRRRREGRGVARRPARVDARDRDAEPAVQGAARAADGLDLATELRRCLKPNDANKPDVLEPARRRAAALLRRARGRRARARASPCGCRAKFLGKFKSLGARPARAPRQGGELVRLGSARQADRDSAVPCARCSPRSRCCSRSRDEHA